MHLSLRLWRLLAIVLLVPSLPAFICPKDPPLLPFEEDGKWGYMNPDKTVVVTPQYKDVQPFSEGMGAFKVESHKWGFVGKEGWVKIEPVHWLVGNFKDGRAWALTIKEKWRYIDTKGNFIDHPEIEYASDFSEKRAHVIRNGKYGFIDTGGKVIVPFEYDVAYPYSEGQALVMKDGKWQALDISGKTLYSVSCDEVFPLSGGMARCRKNNLWGYMDSSGKWKIKPKFERALDFKQDLAPAAKPGGPWMMIDLRGQEEFRFPKMVRWVFPYTCKEMTTFKTDQGFGVIDISGKILKEPQWEFARCLGGSLFNVRHNKKWGYYHLEAGFLWQGSPTDR